MSFEGHEYVEGGETNSDDSHSEYEYEQQNNKITLSDKDQSSISDLYLPFQKNTTLDTSVNKNKLTLKKSSLSSIRQSKVGFSLYFKSAQSFGSKQLSKSS